MDFLNPVINGFAVVLEPTNLLYCLLGVVIGMLIGVLPGLGPAATIAILLPLTYNVEPVTAIIMLAGIFYGAQYGGTITSVLLRLPGEASSVVTVFDGYQMAKQGKAGTALGIAAIGSFIGGTVAIIGLTFLAPVVASFALDFGPPEYTALALLGILLVATISNGCQDQGADRRGPRPAAGHRRPRRLHRRKPLHLRQPGAGRRHRLRADRHGPLRPRRDPLQPRGTPPRRQGAVQGRQRLAVADGPEAVLRRDRPRLGAGLLPGHPARRRRHDRLDGRLRDGEEARQAPGALRQGRPRGRRRTGNRQQRRRHVVLHPAADPGHPGQRHHGPDVRRAADPGRHPRPAAGGAGPRSCSGAW